MQEEKRNRIAGAITVNVIILMVILFAVILYQLIAIVSVNRQKQEILAEIQKYEKLTEEEKETLEYVKSEQFLWDYAFFKGYKFPD